MRIITAALPYANGFLHLGHIASTYLPADIYAKHSKIKLGNENVVFVSATDEHGTPIEVNALKFNLEPEEFVKIFRSEFKKDFEKVNISFDNFYYTHSEENKRLVEEFFEKAKRKNLIYEKKIKALYCESCERFLPDRFVKGSCPYCDASDQYGDVCEVCGRTYSAMDLVEPYCIICKSKPLIKETKHFFFALSKLESEIKKYLEESNLQEDAKNYALSWLKDGLKDIDITRDYPYFGFPIPNYDDKFFYVWVDAPFGYVSSVWNYDERAFKLWREKKAEVIHFIGKDIVYFHYIYWIAMLMVMDFALPKAMPTRGYLTLNKKKMSKSRGNFVYVRDLAEFMDSDYIRYYFARNIPDDITDGDFSFDVFKEKINKELVGIIGNLGYRIVKILEGRELNLEFDFNNDDVFKKVDGLLEGHRIKDALDIIIEYAVKCNEKFNSYEPWKLVKENTESAERKLLELLHDISLLFALLEPYTPKMVKRFYEMLGCKRKEYGILQIKGKVKAKQHVIEKIDENIFSLVSGSDAFCKVDLKIGRIVEVVDIKESDKLYLMKLECGDEVKQVVGGLKKHYTEKELLNKKVVFVNNLKKAKLMGYESEGMLLAASSEDGKVVGLCVVDDELIPSGSEVLVKGMFKNVKDRISIDFFRKIDLIKAGSFVYYKDYPLIARSLCKEVRIKIDRADSIEDGVKLW